VKPSKDSDMKSRRIPIICEGLLPEADASSPSFAASVFFLAPSPPPMNIATPKTIIPTLRYLRRLYFLPRMLPASMTGTGLQLLARTWMG
jgi:hypothetical protein